eukprot:5287740-Pleurochrysis_carterae.AAC.1
MKLLSYSGRKKSKPRAGGRARPVGALAAVAMAALKVDRDMTDSVQAAAGVEQVLLAGKSVVVRAHGAYYGDGTLFDSPQLCAMLSQIGEPKHSTCKSVLLTPTRVLRTALGVKFDGAAPYAPAVIQWTNKRGAPFSLVDARVAERLRQAMHVKTASLAQGMAHAALLALHTDSDRKRLALVETAKM